MGVDFILIFFVVRYFQKNITTQESYPQWYAIFRIVMVAAILLFVAGLIVSPARPPINWLGKLALVGLVYLLYKDPLFKPARSLYIAILPYIVISIFEQIIKDGFPATYVKWNTLLESLELFAILWGVGVWMVNSRQRKELARAKQTVAEQEEKNRMMVLMKEELEKQVGERTSEITRQKEELENTLKDLKATQSQLVHSEKMASLGELTAGIAHEIQNPLNFVNNFSELNKELLQELKEEMSKGNIEEVDALANDIISNEEKINLHGKRADSIVKGMLQHSRTSTGQKELTDVNELCDEYLRLAYHGLRAKDKSFNTEMKTDLDPALPKIKIIPQEIGRVILNLITNAFYTVQQKQKQTSQKPEDYHPSVSVQTISGTGEFIKIIVSDNGNGIPQNIVDKIFQPFFTTKPTGEGTGLGLSLSYDIMKAHGGDIRVESTEGKGTTFILELPKKQDAGL